MVDLYDHTSEQGIAVTTRGLPEYEVLHHQCGGKTCAELAITLLRSVEEIGDWGSFAAETGRELGSHAFEYAVLFHDGSST
jgi:alpha-mannosidase